MSAPAVDRQPKGRRLPLPSIAPALLPPKLRDRLAAGDVILLAGRASDSSGARGRSNAVRNVVAAAEALEAVGFRALEGMPSEEELTRAMVAHGIRRTATGQNGQVLTHHVLEIPLDTQPRIVLLIQQGSGKAISADRHQASAEIVTEAVDRLRPAMLAVSEVRGIVRDHAAIGGPLMAMRYNTGANDEPFHYCDKKEKLQEWSTELEKRLIFRAGIASDEAETTAERTRAGILRLTGGPVVDGQVAYGCGAPLPPPMAVARRTDASGYGQGPRVAYLDTPGCRPAYVAFGVPTIRREKDGVTELVDQVAVLREFYRVLDTPGYDALATVRHIIALGFSTEALRQRSGRGDAQPVLRGRNGKSGASKIVKVILEHIDFHCTGRLTLPVPGGGGPTVVLLPPDGRPICSPGDREPIESARPRRVSLQKRPRVGLLTGHLAVVDGQDATLSLAVDKVSNAIQYQFTRGPNDKKLNPRGRLGAPRHDPIPPLRSENFVIGLARALTDNWLMPALPVESDRTSRLSDALATAEATVRSWTAAKQRAQSMVDKNPDGETWDYVVSNNNEAGRLLRAAKDEVTSLRAQLLRSDEPRGLPLERLLSFFLALRDPYDDTFRDLLGHDLGTLRVRTHRSTGTGRRRVITAITVETELRVLDGDGTQWLLPIAFTQDWRRRDGSARAEKTIEDMRLGVPLVVVRGNAQPRVGVRRALGHADDLCSVVLTRDPHLLRLAMAVNHPADGPRPGVALTDARIRRLAKQLGEPPALLRRLRDIHSAPRRRYDPWVRRRAPELRRLLAQAVEGPVHESDIPSWARATGSWRPYLQRTASGLRMRPCRACGSRQRVRPLIDEMAGLVCLSCRRDDLGHLWPSPTETNAQVRGRFPSGVRHLVQQLVAAKLFGHLNEGPLLPSAGPTDQGAARGCDAARPSETMPFFNRKS